MYITTNIPSPCVAALVVDDLLQMYYICNKDNLSGIPAGYQHKLVEQGRILCRISLPATAVKQLYHAPNITGQARQQRIYLSPIVVKCRVEVSGLRLGNGKYCTIRASPACQRRCLRFLSALQLKIKGRDCGTINGHNESLSIRTLMKDAREVLVR